MENGRHSRPYVNYYGGALNESGSLVLRINHQSGTISVPTPLSE